MDIISRLKVFLDTYRISNSEFADNCGIPRPTVSQLLNGRNKKVSDEIISKIHLGYPSLSMLWLLFGEGSMASGSNIEALKVKNQQNQTNYTDYNPVNKQVTNTSSEQNSVNKFESDKVEDRIFTYYVGSEQDFSENKGENEPENPSGNKPSNNDNSEAASSVQVPADPYKRITNIVVFYSDNSFQSFMPVKNS